mgnify:CR=1 FL=1
MATRPEILFPLFSSLDTLGGVGPKAAKAFEALDKEDPGAADMFAALKEQYPDDPLVNLHHERIMSGILSTTIVLAEK